jgi:hypothetical protein
MIKDIYQYCTSEVIPRWVQIISGPELWVSIAFGFAVMHFESSFVFNDAAKLEKLTNALLTYASIALGFLLAGLTVVLSLPNKEFSLKLKGNKSKVSKKNSFSSLLFVFSWTAICHLLMLVVFMVLLMTDRSYSVLCIGCKTIHEWSIGFISALVLYCVFQFLQTIIAVSMFGNLLIDNIKEDG